MEEVQDINYVFNSVPLHTKEIFSVLEDTEEGYRINEDEFGRFLTYIGYKNDRLVSFCHKCKSKFPFEIKEKIYTIAVKDAFLEGDDKMYFTQGSQIIQVGYLAGAFDLKKGVVIGLQPPYQKGSILNNVISYIEYTFTCTKDFHHKYIMMLSVEFKDACLIVRKIGQNPSMYTIKGFDFDKYNKFLKKINAYDDYKKADLSFGEQFYAGAFTYLRRIFEKMVNYYLEGKNPADNHMETKIDTIKEKLDPRIRGLFNPLYGILSMGIHELDDDQCKKYYEYLKAVIDMQLEYIKTENEKNQQSKELNKVISEITNDLKNN